MKGGLTIEYCEVVTDKLQAEFIYENVEGAKAVASMGVGSLGILEEVGVICRLKEEPSQPAVVAELILFRYEIWSSLSTAQMYLQ